VSVPCAGGAPNSQSLNACIAADAIATDLGTRACGAIGCGNLPTIKKQSGNGRPPEIPLTAAQGIAGFFIPVAQFVHSGAYGSRTDLRQPNTRTAPIMVCSHFLRVFSFDQN